MTNTAPQLTEPGFYRTRLVKGAPWSPVLIWRPCPIEFEPETFQAVDRWGHLVLMVGGVERAFPEDLQIVRPDDVERWAPAYERWPNINPVAEAEYHYMTDLAAWARAWAPDAPEASPRMPVDLAEMQPLF